MRIGRTRVLEDRQWIEIFPITAHDITVTMPVLNRVRATRPEPTIYNNARDLRKYARTDQSPLLVKLDVWEAMLAHIARKAARQARKLELQKRALMRERIKQLYFRAVATGETAASPLQPKINEPTQAEAMAPQETARRHEQTIRKRGGISTKSAKGSKPG